MGLNIRHAMVFAMAGALLVFSQAAWTQDEPVESEVAVTVAQVQRTTLRAYVTAYGYVETAPASKGTAPAGAQLTAPVSGVVSEVACYEGLRVNKGAVLCLLDSRLVEADVERAKQSVAFAEKAWQREKDLQTSDATSEKKLQEAEAALAAARSDLEAARIQLSLHRITAPIAGTVTRLGVVPGEYVETAAEVAEIADFTRLTAALKVPASEAAVLAPGQSVEIKTENGDETLPGTLSFISSRVHADAGAVTAYVALPADTLLQPGRFVSARIACDEHQGCLAVPETSVVKDTETGGWIIAVVKNGRAVQMNVKTGLRENGLVEVSADGLSEGMTVVKVGAYGLPDSTRVRVTENTETEAGQ